MVVRLVVWWMRKVRHKSDATSTVYLQDAKAMDDPSIAFSLQLASMGNKSDSSYMHENDVLPTI